LELVSISKEYTVILQTIFAEMIKPGRPTDCYRIIFNEKNESVQEISFHRLNSTSMTAEFNIKIANPY